MSRWWMVALAAVAGIMVWAIATWPLPPEVDNAEDSAPEAEPAPAARVLPSPTVEYAPPPPAAEPAPQEPAPTEPPAAAAPPEPADKEATTVFTRENGPLAEYKAQFEKEPRDSAASDAEQVVRGAFVPKDSPEPVFRSVLCRETICRIETRFTAENMGAYVAAMTRMVHYKFDGKLATERTSAPDSGEVSVTVYAKRPPSTP
jgi:type IV secretory pathway VirB10-like protein